MEKLFREQLFQKYAERYNHILQHIYPAKNSTGFPERNLSVNFSRAFEELSLAQNQETLSWFEFQFGVKNNCHVDAILLNITQGEMYVVESKRYSHPGSKKKQVGTDIVRIENLVEELKQENNNGIVRINMNNIQRCYGIILADVWTETPSKTDILESYKIGVEDPNDERSFLNKYQEEICLNRTLLELYYNVQGTEKIGVRNYNLVSVMWEIRFK